MTLKTEGTAPRRTNWAEAFDRRDVPAHTSSDTAEQPLRLRSYQLDEINRIKSEVACGRRWICVVAPTGAGKTVIAGVLIAEAVARGGPLGRPYRNYRAGVLRLKGAKIGPVVFKSPLSSIVFKDLVFQLDTAITVPQFGDISWISW